MQALPVSRWIMPIAAMVAVSLFPQLSHAQSPEPFQHRGFISLGGGVASSSVDIIDELYGSLPAARLAVGYHISRRFRVTLGAKIASKGGRTISWTEPNIEYTAEPSLMLREGHLMLEYLSSWRWLGFYLGAGVVVGVSTEEIDITSRSYAGYTEQFKSRTNVTAVGPTGTAGLEVPLAAVFDVYSQIVVTSLERDNMVGQEKFSTVMFEIGGRFTFATR